jgi:hypothetical protein
VSRNEEAAGVLNASGADGASVAEVTCVSGMEASVGRSGTVPCRDVVTGDSVETSADGSEASAGKSGTVPVPCRVATGASAETSGAASEASLLLGP